MQLAQGEIMKAQAEFGRDIGVRILLMGQADIQSDGLGCDIEGASIRGLHYSRPSASYDYRVGLASPPIRRSHEAPQFAGDVVVVTFGADSFSYGHPACQFQITWIGCQQCAQRLDLTV